MSERKRAPLADRVAAAAAASLAEQKHVSVLDVFRGLGWVDPNSVRRWQNGQVDCLERHVQSSPERIVEALGLLAAWAAQQGLAPTEMDYVARSPERPTLRFSLANDPDLERQYRVHWVSPELSERQQARLVERKSRAPDLVVIQPLNSDWSCHRCGGGGDGLLIMEQPGPACLKCVGLDDLEFLGSGDAKLTRRAKSKSARFAVVVRFSRTRRRYERQGLLVEPQALAAAERELAAPQV
jgi:hypothetical protein